MFDWGSLQVESLKSGVRSVFVPQELLQLALAETGAKDLQGDGLAKVRDWLLEQIAAQLAIPVIQQAGAFFKPVDGGARLIFLSR
ncbi:MAG TPA: hypothetical protein VIL95_01665 [Bacillota bacterium]